MSVAPGASSKARDALVRESKDHIAIDVIDLCRELHIRAMLGGGPVLNANGLLAPGVSRSAAILVDPASFRHLRSALLQRGWHDSTARRIRVLPPARFSLSHADEVAGLNIYPFIPGFFADPEETFDVIWERHKEVPLRGHTVRALGRINSAILASHDGLDGRLGRARSNFDYFVAQFGRVLNQHEREVTVDLIRKMGGCAEMDRLVRALGFESCEFTLPSVAYVQWRLQITDVSDQVRRAVALLELGKEGRAMLYESNSGRPKTFGDVVKMIVRLPRTCIDIFGAGRRWKRSLV
ncbi:MAG TPA: hypothetical protein VHX87_02945 [Galbitalea sp.]|jgi:hypothetical protein|nr:hypothetical protein [Galbitalea sp.]